MCSLINKQLLLTAYAYLFIMEQQKGQQGSEALQLECYQGAAAQKQQLAFEKYWDDHTLTPKQMISLQVDQSGKSASVRAWNGDGTSALLRFEDGNGRVTDTWTNNLSNFEGTEEILRNIKARVVRQPMFRSAEKGMPLVEYYSPTGGRHISALVNSWDAMGTKALLVELNEKTIVKAGAPVGQIFAGKEQSARFLNLLAQLGPKSALDALTQGEKTRVLAVSIAATGQTITTTSCALRWFEGQTEKEKTEILDVLDEAARPNQLNPFQAH